MSEDNDELLGMFVQEAMEHLETIEPDLLTLEEKGKETDSEIINRLFRGVHSIKGSAGFFGLGSITKLSHIMENLLGKVRERTMDPTPAVTDSLLAGLDKLKAMINDVSTSDSIDATEEVHVIERLLSGESGQAPAVAASAPAPSPSPPPAAQPVEKPAAKVATPASEDFSATAQLFNLEEFPDALREAVQHGKHFFAVTMRLPADGDSRIQYYQQTKSMLATVGSVAGSYPALQSDRDLAGLDENNLTLLFATVLEKDLLSALVQLPMEQIWDVAIPRELAKTHAPAKPIPAKVAAKPAAPLAVVAKPALPVKEVEEEVEEEEESRPALVKPPGLSAPKTGKPAAAATAPRGDEEAKSGAPAVEETLRVSVSLLDELINNAGELVLARNQLIRAAVQVAQQYPHISPLIQNLDSITSRIQERVMQARMQPVSVVFNKFPRIIRDLARKLEKKINLELRGGEVELDKSVIEHLSDPLTHMIRNVADHAIETPKERLSLKKPEEGKVELAAYHENGMVNISLTDDGAGIDHEHVKMKALEKGLINERQADVMGEQDALNLIFLPGFSTAKKVSDVSGRGVGMDVVRTNIEKLGGTVHIESKVGKGTRIVLKLPLTLAIIPAMIVSAGNQRFAIPEVGLVEIVRVTESERANQIELVGNAPVLRLRNALLPLVDLAEVIGVQRFWPPGSSTPDRRRRLADRRGSRIKNDPPAATPAKSSKPSNRSERRDEPPPKEGTAGRREPTNMVAYVMVINVGGNEFGMVVDEVLDSEEIVVKPLPSFFKDNPCFSATTILGDGSVALIIDYAGVMESSKILFTNVEKAARMDLDDERRAALRERQNIILLETGSGAHMGIVHSMVRRVEKISPTMLETIGGLPYVRYDGRTFRAVYPDQALGLESGAFGQHHVQVEQDGEGDGDLCMVVPNIPNIQAGLIFTRIIDTRETNVDLDTRAIRINGLFGSSQIDDRVVLFPDVYAVLDIAGIPSLLQGAEFKVQGLRALVADDTPFLRALTTNYLVNAGFVVDQAEDGQMALTQLKNKRYDLLVTDLNMPVMDGFELAAEIAGTANPDIPMIATTSSISTQLVQRCSVAGFVSCVPTIDKNRLMS
ncbi:MAG: hybrid sensor histidine kinase/response regulator, partial [Magnetococcales bacterium]|nr:hybrid sensor histidine kinase/response regulator [Magnetococcales bacterium]